jgi:hypothetical protein
MRRDFRQDNIAKFELQPASLLTSVAPNWVINRGEERMTDAKTSLCNIKARGSKRLRVERPASMAQ